MSAKQSKPSSTSRRDELFALSRDMLLTAINVAGGAPSNDEQAREFVRLARAVQSEVDKSTPRQANDVATKAPRADPLELTDDNF